MIDKTILARQIAAVLSSSEIAGHTLQHDAMRQAELDRDAALLIRLADAAGLDLAEISGRMLLAAMARAEAVTEAPEAITA